MKNYIFKLLKINRKFNLVKKLNCSYLLKKNSLVLCQLQLITLFIINISLTKYFIGIKNVIRVKYLF